MMLGHKSKDNMNEEYIRVSAEIRSRFYEYANLICADNKTSLHLFMEKTA
jgi:hypothetical protein